MSRSLLGWVTWLFVLVGAGTVLSANSVDVTSTGGRWFYAALCGSLLLNAVWGFLLLWFFERTPSGSFRGVTTLRTVVACGATLGLFFSLEALARTFPIYDSIGINPGTHFMWPEFFLPRNSLGYKDREPGVKRGPRILVLGDSFTEGAGVRRPDRFSNVLEKLYRTTTDPELEVYNAGHCGMDTLDEARILAATGDRIDPDVVVIAYVVNDADGQGLRPTEARPSRLRQLFLEKLNSYAFYRLYSRRWRAVVPAHEDPFLDQHRLDSSGWKVVIRSLDQIAAWAEERSIPAILIALPLFADYGERYRAALDQVVEAAHARGFRARHSIDDYAGRLAELSVSAHDAHPGKEAHYITAVALHRFIGRPWTEAARSAKRLR